MTQLSIKGVDELVVALKKRTDLNLVRETVRLNTSELQKKAQRNAPVDTGYLRRSIGVGSGIADKGLSGRVFANADYAGYVEWGTRYMYAQPYMRPAFNLQKGKFLSDMKRIMR